jgi:hypothetical protein
MKSKLMWLISCVLIVAMTMAGAMAYSDWAQPLTPDKQSLNSSRANIVGSHWLPTATFLSNCSIPSLTSFSILSDNLTRSIWVEAYSSIDLYDTQCNLLYQRQVNGTNWGGAFIWDYDHDLKPNILVPIKTPDNTMSLASYEWNGTNLSNDKTIDLGVGASSCSGVYCDRNLDVCAVLCNDGNIKRINLTANTYSNLASTIGFSYSGVCGFGQWQPSGCYPDKSPIQNSVTGGDINEDGNLEIMFYNMVGFTGGVCGSNACAYMYGMVYDLTTNTILTTMNDTTKTEVGYSYGSGTQTAFVSYVGSPYVIGKTGAPNSVSKIFQAFSGDGAGSSHGGYQNVRVFDSNWNVLQTIKGQVGGADGRMSNWMIGDYNGDGNYEHCLVYNANLTCWSGTYSQLGSFQVPTYIGEATTSNPLSTLMLDYDDNGTKDFITPYNIRNLAGGIVGGGVSWGLNSSNNVNFIPVDFSNDGKLDIVWGSNLSNAEILSTGTQSGGGGNCSRATCLDSNCQFYDAFEYNCSINSMGWNVQNYPLTDIYPTSGKMCYNGQLLSLQDWDNLPTFYTTQINEFDINVSSSYQASKELTYTDSTTGLWIPVWHLDFWSDGSISYYENNSAVSLCGAGCFNVNQYNHIKVISYSFTTNGAQFYNSTSHQYEYNQPNTFSVIINNNTRFDNLHPYHTLTQGHSNSIWGVNYSWYGGTTCIDNETLRGDLSSYGNQTGCSSGFDYYTYPIVWVDTFPYADTITNHGWSGYPYVVGDNIYNACNKLFIDANKSLNPVNYTFNPSLTSDFVMKWDMWLESSLGNNTYDPIGMPTQITFEKSNGTHQIHINFNSAGEIVNVLHGGGSQVLGNWDGSGEFSYKVIAHPSNHTFEFYFTNASNNFEYVEACSDCAWENNGTIDKFVITPYPIDPYGYYNIGIWMDNIYLTMGTAEQNFTEAGNFCNFEGCIFFDPFNYTDDTYAHGWYMFNTTPSAGVVDYSNSTQGYYFEHQIDTIHSTDNGGIFSVQFKAMFPTPPQTALDLIHFQLSNGEGGKPIDLEFSNGIIFDVNRGVSSLGSYSYNSWNTYTLLVNLNDNTYDLYMNSNQLVSNGGITIPATEIVKGGFWVNTNSSIKIDYITIAKGSIMVDAIANGIVSETGVPISDLKWCWSKTNGSFDWSCCSAEENATKTMLCPARVTFRYALGGITNFVLGNFIYFLIIVIIFVMITPYIAPLIRREQR